MNNKLYVGNLPYSSTDASLSTLFAQCGEVLSAKVITDRETGRSKGFGFVEMSTAEEAEQAINQFNGSDLDGRSLRVNVAQPQQNRPRNNRNHGSRSDRSRY